MRNVTGLAMQLMGGYAELLPALLATKTAIESRLRSFTPRGKLLRTRASYAMIGGVVPLQ